MTTHERAIRDLRRATERFNEAHAAWIAALDADMPREIIAQYRHDREVAHAVVVQAREIEEGLR